MTRGGLHSGLNTYVANDLINEIEITTEIENTNLGIVFPRTPCIMSSWHALIHNDVLVCLLACSSSSVYSPFSDRVGPPPHNTPIPGVLMKSIGAFLRPDAHPDVNHTRGMQYQTGLNIILWPEIN